MELRQYHINKAINRPPEIQGLKGQYIGIFAACLVGIFVTFGVMYACGMSLYVCTPSALGLGGLALSRVFAMNRKYGQFGRMKKMAWKNMPRALQCRSRKGFIQLYSDHVQRVRGVASDPGSIG